MMSQTTLFPEGLSTATRETLRRRQLQVRDVDHETLLTEARKHLETVRIAAVDNSFINVRLAADICDRLHAVSANWDRVPSYARPWFKAAMAYYCDNLDDVPDLDSPIGFEDDCEVLNACLKLAQREDLCLNPEDYDDF